jgi:hypothetical protein
LHDAGLRLRRKAVRIPLTQRHIQECLQWAQTHVTWTVNDWTPVLLLMSQGFVWTSRTDGLGFGPNELLAQACVAEHNLFSGGSVMMWAGKSAQGETDLTHH